MRLRWPAISACYRGRYYPTWSIQPPNLPRFNLKQKESARKCLPQKVPSKYFLQFLWTLAYRLLIVCVNDFGCCFQNNIFRTKNNNENCSRSKNG